MVNQSVFDEAREQFPVGCISDESSFGTCAFLYGLIAMRQPRRVVELGSCTGVASIWMGRALAEVGGEGILRCYEIDEAKARISRDRLTRANLGIDWDVIVGDFFAHSEVDADFAFIDLVPKNAYYEALRHLRIPAGGIVAAHDTVHTDQGAVNFARDLAANPEWTCINFPWERGIVVGIKA